MQSAFHGANLAVDSSSALTQLRIPETRYGPEERTIADSSTSSNADTTHDDQCIFLRYYMLKRRFSILKSILKAGAGPHQLPYDGSQDGTSAVRALTLAGEDDDGYTIGYNTPAAPVSPQLRVLCWF